MGFETGNTQENNDFLIDLSRIKEDIKKNPLAYNNFFEAELNPEKNA